ncbi:MAG: VanW family protein [Chloroflexi bacterium]|nr:VanW family protein [Chloroflexota bacterium]
MLSTRAPAPPDDRPRPLHRTRPSTPPLEGSLPFGPVAGCIAAVLLGAILVLELISWGRITPGTSGLGVALGGTTPEEASNLLAPRVEALLSRPIELRYRGQTWNTTARDLGLTLDPDQVAQTAFALGREGNPLARLSVQISALAGGQSIDVGDATEDATLDTALGQIAGQIDQAPRDAALAVGGDGSLQTTAAQSGVALDIPASRERVETALANGFDTVDLVVVASAPAVTDDQLQSAQDELNRLLSDDQPFTLTSNGETVSQLGRADLAALVTLGPASRDGQPASVQIADAPLQDLVHRIAGSVNQDAQDARFSWNGGDLQVIRPSHDGRALDEAATAAGIRATFLAGEHSLELPISVTRPQVSDQDPQSLGITEEIDDGSTSFAGSVPEKVWNIQLAARKLNGVVVPPGGTFSFNKEIGPTTLEAGFKWGFGITTGDGGIHTVPSVAGGICQVATTLFQPVFWSGYQLEERYWHLYWIPAYTSRGVVGLDVTVDSDSNLDFKWINPTSNYILIQASADDSNIYFGLYGKKPDWTVKVDDAVISNRTPADPHPSAQAEPTLAWGRTLIAQSAREGFDVDVKRHVIPADGGQSRDLDLKSSYQAVGTITLIGTGGAPANADVSSLIAKVVGNDSSASKPVDNRPAGGSGASTTTSTGAQPTTAPAQATPSSQSQSQTSQTSQAGQGSSASPTQAAVSPTAAPTSAPAAKPTSAPTAAPTSPPAAKPTAAPTTAPTSAPSKPAATPTTPAKTGPNTKPAG